MNNKYAKILSKGYLVRSNINKDINEWVFSLADEYNVNLKDIKLLSFEEYIEEKRLMDESTLIR